MTTEVIALVKGSEIVQASLLGDLEPRMQRFGPDKKKQNLVYFELSREDAKALMNEGGLE